jgi:hypothetical protein
VGEVLAVLENALAEDLMQVKDGILQYELPMI